HGKRRWPQGPTLDAVICQASTLRRILFDKWVDAFARQTPQFEGENRRAADNIIHQAVDDVVTESATPFVAAQETVIYRLHAETADGGFERRWRRVLSCS